MDHLSAWDRWVINAAKAAPPLFQGVLEVGDTLRGCWLAAQDVFGKDATPEHALKLLELAVEHTAAMSEEDLESNDPGDEG